MRPWSGTDKESDVDRRERFILVTGLLLGLLMGIVGFHGANPGAWAQRDADSVSSEDVVDLVGRGVVTVVNRVQTPNGFMEAVGTGSGFIIDGDGHIVTNNHVVQGGEAFDVIFADGTYQPVVLIGTDPISDIAVLRVEGELPAILAWGESDLLRRGQPVLAIGSPLQYDHTVTEGIVSALERDDPASTTFVNMIQHDAAINRGNSGGPLVNMAGEVIGVTTVAATVAADSDAFAQGISFSTPSNAARAIVDELIAYGSVLYPDSGILFERIWPDLAAFSNLPVSYGVLVKDVAVGGSAALADVQIGDIIVSIGGTPLDRQTTYSEALFAFESDDVVDFEIIRDGQVMLLQVKLGQLVPAA